MRRLPGAVLTSLGLYCSLGLRAEGPTLPGPRRDTTWIGARRYEAEPAATDFWTPTATEGAPSARFQHTAVWTGARMILWGGANASSVLNDGGQYDPVGNTWTAVATAGAPSARAAHTAVWTGSRMIVWGRQRQRQLPERRRTVRSGGEYLDGDIDDGRAVSTVRANRSLDGFEVDRLGWRRTRTWWCGFERRRPVRPGRERLDGDNNDGRAFGAPSPRGGLDWLQNDRVGWVRLLRPE